MLIIYIILGLFTMWVVYWTYRITKAVIVTLDYKFLTKAFIVILTIGAIINWLDYLITS